jgi:hypothetical protein
MRSGFSPTSRAGFGAATVQSDVAEAGLLVLDQAWAELDNQDDGADGPSISWSDGENSVDDEALAAVFSDDAELWKAL